MKTAAAVQPDSVENKACRLARMELRNVQEILRKRAARVFEGGKGTPKRAVYGSGAEWTAKVRLSGTQSASTQHDVLQLGPFGTELEAQVRRACNLALLGVG